MEGGKKTEGRRVWSTRMKRYGSCEKSMEEGGGGGRSRVGGRGGGGRKKK